MNSTFAGLLTIMPCSLGYTRKWSHSIPLVLSLILHSSQIFLNTTKRGWSGMEDACTKPLRSRSSASLPDTSRCDSRLQASWTDVLALHLGHGPVSFMPVEVELGAAHPLGRKTVKPLPEPRGPPAQGSSSGVPTTQGKSSSISISYASPGGATQHARSPLALSLRVQQVSVPSERRSMFGIGSGYCLRTRTRWCRYKLVDLAESVTNSGTVVDVIYLLVHVRVVAISYYKQRRIRVEDGTKTWTGLISGWFLPVLSFHPRPQLGLRCSLYQKLNRDRGQDLALDLKFNT